MVASLIPAASAMALVVAPRKPRCPKTDIATSMSCALRSVPGNRLRGAAGASSVAGVAVASADNVLTGRECNKDDPHPCRHEPAGAEKPAGGGYAHGRHIVHEGEHNAPLCNLFVTLLQGAGHGPDVAASHAGPRSEIASMNA